MLIMLIKKVAQSCRLGNKAEFVYKPIGNMNQSKNLTLLTISRFSGQQLDIVYNKNNECEVICKIYIYIYVKNKDNVITENTVRNILFSIIL